MRTKKTRAEPSLPSARLLAGRTAFGVWGSAAIGGGGAFPPDRGQSQRRIGGWGHAGGWTGLVVPGNSIQNSQNSFQTGGWQVGALVFRPFYRPNYAIFYTCTSYTRDMNYAF